MHEWFDSRSFKEMLRIRLFIRNIMEFTYIDNQKSVGWGKTILIQYNLISEWGKIQLNEGWVKLRIDCN